jgi:hypothetical protein
VGGDWLELRGVTPGSGRLVALLWAVVIYGAAALGFQRMAEYEDFTVAAAHHRVVAIGLGLVVLGALVASVAALSAGVLIGGSIARETLRTRRPDLVRPLAACVGAVVAILAALGLLVVYAHLAAPRPPHDPRNLAVVVAWLAVSSALGVTALLGASRAILHTTLEPARVRFAGACARLVADGIALTTIGVLVWGIALRVADPTVFYLRDGGFLATPTPITWIADLVAMLAALAIAPHPLTPRHRRHRSYPADTATG